LPLLSYTLSSAKNATYGITNSRSIQCFAKDAQGDLIDTGIKSPVGFDKRTKNKASQWQEPFQDLENNK
jgi:hypothetical protein